MDHELEKELALFFHWFEEVFDRDWPYTKIMLGIRETKDEDRKELEAIFGECEIIYTIAPDGTFLNPRVDNPGEDWGHRGLLLESYQRLVPLLNKHGIDSSNKIKNDEKV